METKMKHFSHEHPLTLKAEEHKIDDGTNQSVKIIKCDGCSTPISGPFYSCRECSYILHKVCAELPNEMNYPMHPQHPLTLFLSHPCEAKWFWCDMCREIGTQFVYHCSICNFDVDMICASASHTIEDKCHQHPLIPLQLPISFPCHICRTKEEGFSYKCNICPFWVHQNCTVSLPTTVKHSQHDHVLTLLQSLPPKYESFMKCDICYNQLSTFHNIYCCTRCMFCAHVSCARTVETPRSPRSRDQDTEINQLDDQCLAFLPVQQKSTDLIAWFAENFRDRDAITNLLLGFAEGYIDREPNINKEIIFFGHTYPLITIDDKLSEELCEACALPISSPSYGCNDCGYIFHKHCTELPKHILHPAHPQHQISLWHCKRFSRCDCCHQWSNGFFYNCYQCRNFRMDIKCASLLRPVKYKSHKHPLIPRFIPSSACCACGDEPLSNSILQCTTCSFGLCFRCAMAPPMMKHRYDKHPFMLTYSPPENHYNEYICDLCEEDLNPKQWYYHCSLCDQFTHLRCMLIRGADSNIKYGKTFKFKVHEHRLTLVSCTYNSSFCNKCRRSMERGYSVGLECIPCNFRIHLLCALNITTLFPN